MGTTAENVLWGFIAAVCSIPVLAMSYDIFLSARTRNRVVKPDKTFVVCHHCDPRCKYKEHSDDDEKKEN